MKPIRGAVRISLVIFILFGSDTFELSDGATDSCHLRELELCVIGAVSFLQNPNGIPANEAEFKRHCEYMQEACDCFREYAERCLTKGQDSIARLFANDMFELEKDLCKEGSELRARYLKHATCLRQVQRKHQNVCMSDFQAGFEGIHKMNNTMRLPTGCCNANRLKGCIFSPVEEECGSDARDLISLFLRKMFGNIITVSCKDFEPQTDTCLTLLPKPRVKPHTGRNTSAISRIISSYTRI